MPEVKNYKELRVWQNGVDLAELVYRVTSNFPQDERYGLTSQMRRAAVSIPANIAEGKGRESLNDYLHFLAISRDSLLELETHLVIAARLQFVSQEQTRLLQLKIEETIRPLNAMITTLKNKRPSKPPHS